MTLSIEELRAKWKADKPTRVFDSSSIFSFSKLQPGDQVKIRFIEDGEENEVFWRPRCTRTLRFGYIKLLNGEIVQNPAYVSVPAFNIQKGEINKWNLPQDYLYYNTDDVLQLKIKPLWDGTPEGRELYSRYRRTERFIFQGFVHAEGYETKLYRFIINNELYNIIKSFAEDLEIGAMPCDPINGRDFILKVTEKTANINGVPQKVKDYRTSKWSSIVTPLSDEEKTWLQDNPPYVLKNFISARPSVEQEKVMLEMFEASYNGEPYDVAKWGHIFKPDNISFDQLGNIKDMKGNSSMSAPSDIPASPMLESVEEPVTAPVDNTTSAPNIFNSMSRDQIMEYLKSTGQLDNIGQPVQPTPIVNQNPHSETIVDARPNEISKPTANQLVNQHSETIGGNSPHEVISNIMDKLAPYNS